MAKRNWDALAAFLVSASFVCITLATGRVITDIRPLLIAAVPCGLAIATGAMVGGRWMSDRLKDSAYGEVIRTIDSDESRFQKPADVTVAVGIAVTVLAALLLLVANVVNSTWTIFAGGLLLGLTLYGVLSLGVLYVVTRQHAALVSELRSLQEQEERRRRESPRGEPPPPGPDPNRE